MTHQQYIQDYIQTCFDSWAEDNDIERSLTPSKINKILKIVAADPQIAKINAAIDQWYANPNQGVVSDCLQDLVEEQFEQMFEAAE